MKELLLICHQDKAEPLADLLMDLGALSVVVEDADRDTEQESPLFGEPGTEPDVLAWERNHVVALLNDEEDIAELLAQVQEQTGQDYTPYASERAVPEEDWVRMTQSQFDPIQIGQRLWIVPSWHQENPAVQAAHQNSDTIFIELDPGLAFGTGSHPTTRLCAEWLEQHALEGKTVLDYGCGSGILALIAYKLNAQSVIGIDIDEQAVEAATYNAQVNHCEVDFALPEGLPDGQFDVVVANILSSPLKLLAPMLAGRVKSGGDLILSGVLERQAQEVAQAYAPWIALTVWRSHEGWVCLHGRKA